MTTERFKLAPVRYGALRPDGRQAHPIDAVKAIIEALTDEHGVRLGLRLTDDQAARLLHDLKGFGWEVNPTKPDAAES